MLLTRSDGALLILSFLDLLVVALTAKADLYECDGTWTNRPCPESTFTKRLNEKTSVSSTSSENRNVTSQKNNRENSTASVCPHSTNLIKLRPDPRMEWSMVEEKLGIGAVAEMTVQITVSGFGKVKITLNSSDPSMSPNPKHLWSTDISLPNSGGMKSISHSFHIPRTAQWNLVAQNSSAFPGFCSDRSESSWQLEWESQKNRDHISNTSQQLLNTINSNRNRAF